MELPSVESASVRNPFVYRRNYRFIDIAFIHMHEFVHHFQLPQGLFKPSNSIMPYPNALNALAYAMNGTILFQEAPVSLDPFYFA